MKTLELWHGGNIKDSFDETISHKKGRFEYGPGLYLITHYDTAKKYAKGNRKLYKITIREGNDANDVFIDISKVNQFIKEVVIRNKQKEILLAISKYENKIRGSYFINIMINYNAIKPSDSYKMRQFLVDNGIDYYMIDNPFGWRELMVVVFNFRVIIKKEIISPNTKIDIYDLPQTFS